MKTTVDSWHLARPVGQSLHDVTDVKWNQQLLLISDKIIQFFAMMLQLHRFINCFNCFLFITSNEK